mmetsp:Transcript_4871/g.13667  ORF Transcript_4871/g.13667 Transcript_4871/m.13667 type:complete len:321 (-) Transcript_4871:1608-2570(-)
MPAERLIASLLRCSRWCSRSTMTSPRPTGPTCAEAADSGRGLSRSPCPTVEVKRKEKVASPGAKMLVCAAAVVVETVGPPLGGVITSLDRVSAARGGNKPTTPPASASFASATAPRSADGGAFDARDSQECSTCDAGTQSHPSDAPATARPPPTPTEGMNSGSQVGTSMCAPTRLSPSPSGGTTSSWHTAFISLENQKSTLSEWAPVPRKLNLLHSSSPIASTLSKMPTCPMAWAPLAPPAVSSSSARERHCLSHADPGPRLSTRTARKPGSSEREILGAFSASAAAVMRTEPFTRSAAKAPVKNCCAGTSELRGPRCSV